MFVTSLSLLLIYKNREQQHKETKMPRKQSRGDTWTIKYININENYITLLFFLFFLISALELIVLKQRSTFTYTSLLTFNIYLVCVVLQIERLDFPKLKVLFDAGLIIL